MTETPDEPFVTVHVVEAPNGHIDSMDCWCEPSKFIFQRNAVGTMLKMVAHEDYTFMHRNDVVILRNKKPGWLTELLSYVGTIGFSDA